MKVYVSTCVDPSSSSDLTHYCRWLRRYFNEFESRPEDMEVITDNPFLPVIKSPKYREACALLNVPTCRVLSGPLSTGDWPKSDLALLQV